MKKLVAAGCCVFFLQTFSKYSVDNDATGKSTSGRRVLIKAISAIVNSEANKKLPPKRVFVASSEPPWPDTTNPWSSPKRTNNIFEESFY